MYTKLQHLIYMYQSFCNNQTNCLRSFSTVQKASPLSLWDPDQYLDSCGLPLLCRKVTIIVVKCRGLLLNRTLTLFTQILTVIELHNVSYHVCHTSVLSSGFLIYITGLSLHHSQNISTEPGWITGDGVNIDPSKIVPQDLTKILIEDIIHQLKGTVPPGNS